MKALEIGYDLMLDHILHVVQTPEETRHDYEHHLGVHTVYGGEHPHWGLHNALVHFELPYVELIGVKDAAKAATTSMGSFVQKRLSYGEGGGWFALRTRQMDEIVESWKKQGLEFVGPVEASRDRPDGSTAHWRMLFPGDLKLKEIERGEALLPFIIEWEDPDEKRVTDLRATGAFSVAQPFRLSGFHVATGEPTAWVRLFNEYFGMHSIKKEGRTSKQESHTICIQVNGPTLYVEAIQDSFEEISNQSPFPGVSRVDVSLQNGASANSSTEQLVAGLAFHLD